MKKIKVLHCLSGLIGGTGKVVENYYSFMPKDDYEFDIVTQGKTDKMLIEEYENKNIKIYIIPSKREDFFGNIIGLYKLMKEKKYDIVHAHMTLTNCFPLFIAFLLGVKVRISHSHLAVSKETGVRKIYNYILKKISWIFATDYFACGVEAAKYLFIKKWDKAIILNNAINLELYKSNSEKQINERNKLNLKFDDIVIGHIGRFSKQKNHVFLIKLLKQMVIENKSVKLMLIGDGELYNEVFQIALKCKLENNIIFTGQIDDVYNKIQIMDVFVLPSNSEGLCIAAIEAQANGLPCIFSDKVAYETKINDNVEFFNLDDDIKKWSDKCLEFANMPKKKDIKLLQNRGFDISIEAKKLDMFYKNKINFNR